MNDNEQEVKQVIINYLLDRRSALCRELASVERQLECLGQPVKNPKIKTDGIPNAIGAGAAKNG